MKAETLTRRRPIVARSWWPFVFAIAIVIPGVARTEEQTPETSDADSIAAPMVSGFDRFARYDELSPTLAGSLMISELSCVSCHASDDPWLQPKRGPRLTGAGNRLQPQWLKQYLADPAAMKPETTMPHVLSQLPESERGEAIDALVAFLGSQQQPFAVIKAGGALPVVHEFWKRGDADRGNKLYHTVGCVACHDPDPNYETVESKPSAIDELIEQLDPEEIADLGLASEARRVDSVPHGNLVSKYSQRSLTMMLLDPTKTRPSARMPSLRLSPLEAADIAAHLLRDQTAKQIDMQPNSAPQTMVEKGRGLFVALRCASCHDASDALTGESSGALTVAAAKPLSQLNADAGSSCIENPDGEIPRYALDNEQRRAILARLTDGGSENRTAADEVDFRMLQLNCYGCHRRDERGGVGRFRKAYFETVGHVDLGDEGRLPPTLGGVGRKLLPKALAAVFHPKTGPHRPFMAARMPSYSADTVDPLVRGFQEADRVDQSDAVDILPPQKEMADAGRDLVNTGCVGCHAFRGESLPGVVGIDLAGTTNRIDSKWFYEFVLNPSAVKKRTRMPTFFPDGKSNRPELLDGNVRHQISAIWAYLKNMDREPLPEKIETVRSANYELAPSGKPIVLRTFMEQAGTHAIAVGFPQGVHFAFDAEQMRLAIGWKQRFLDARGTWFERFTPPADPLGDAQIAMPAGPVVIADENGGEHEGENAGYRFRGYRLDAAGVPTFLYDIAGWSIEDRIEATESGTLKRSVTARRAPSVRGDTSDQKLHLLAHAAERLKPQGEFAVSDQQGLTVTLTEALARTGSLRRSGDSDQWLIPLDSQNRNTAILEYRW
ncbi:c-type cytochrome [Planctomycetes bacterium TBK1r]|uniref:Cytochrome c n=1 Tax=Stieleria magnilauensis TaxID=2527963 RepID=A0ABX5XM71_9BACT|nr:Cytochrome c [Planctomycetes bacterium TBK1r]